MNRPSARDNAPACWSRNDPMCLPHPSRISRRVNPSSWRLNIRIRSGTTRAGFLSGFRWWSGHVISRARPFLWSKRNHRRPAWDGPSIPIRFPMRHGSRRRYNIPVKAFSIPSPCRSIWHPVFCLIAWSPRLTPFRLKPIPTDACTLPWPTLPRLPIAISNWPGLRKLRMKPKHNCFWRNTTATPTVWCFSFRRK